MKQEGAGVSLACAQCGEQTRPFPAGVVDGGVEITEAVPFARRLAFKCTKCGGLVCAPCCHPPEVARLLANAPSLPREYTTARPDAACPRCRGLVRPFGADEAEEPEAVFDENKPVTPAQRMMAVLVAVFGLGIAAWCFQGGAWGRGLFWAAIGGAAAWAALSK